MQAEIPKKIEEVKMLCIRCGVRALYVFGSALREDFDPLHSDYDFLVEFAPMPPGDHADAFFSLKSGLEALFQRPVDLVTLGSIRNPYFSEQVIASRQLLYAA
jgi:predicted nucleotidyltransferase